MHLNDYTQYYTLQEGGGLGAVSNNNNSRENSYNQFSQVRLPRVYQRGNGVGGFFSSIWRFLQPMLKSGTNFLKTELSETGIDMLRGINEQKPIKEILRNRSVKAVDNLRDKAINKINEMTGSGLNRKRKNRGAAATINKKSKRLRSQSRLRIKLSKVAEKKSRRKVRKTLKNNSRILDIFK